MYVYRDRELAEAPLCVRFINQSAAAREANREKCGLLISETVQNKDNFRRLITIWSIGVASRGLNELIFVKT